MLTIADLEFEIEKSDFNAYISVDENGYGLKWNIEVLAKPKEIPVVDEENVSSEWQPFIQTHAFLKLPSLDKLANTEFTLTDELDDEPQFCLEVFDYEAIRDVKISFEDWVNNEIEFSLQGIANVYYDNKYDEDLNITLNTLLRPNFVQIGTANEQQAEQLLAKFLPNIQVKKRKFDERLGFIYNLN